MLTAVTMTVQDMASHDASLSQDTQQKVANLSVIPYLSDTGFSTLMLDQGVNQKDVTELNQVYKTARLKATRAGMVATAVMTLLFLFGTRNLPVRARGSDDAQEKSRVRRSRKSELRSKDN